MHRIKRKFPSQAASLMLGLTLGGSVWAQEAPLIPSLTGSQSAGVSLPPIDPAPAFAGRQTTPTAPAQPPVAPLPAPAAQPGTPPGMQPAVSRANKVVIP